MSDWMLFVAWCAVCLWVAIAGALAVNRDRDPDAIGPWYFRVAGSPRPRVAPRRLPRVRGVYDLSDREAGRHTTRAISAARTSQAHPLALPARVQGRPALNQPRHRGGPGDVVPRGVPLDD